MRHTLTISLPETLRQQLARAAESEQVSQSEFVRKAVQDRLWQDAFKAARREFVPKARAMGIYTDEDVFKIIS
jgi:metal-responsive CopG/Arc/MetJ family transcriptional regulator